MSHVSIIRFKHSHSDFEELHGRVQALADAQGKVKGVISSRTFTSHDNVILFAELEDFATMDRLSADAETKAARVGLYDHGDLEASGHEFWSGRAPSHIRE